jgi:hypothetical protein
MEVSSRRCSVVSPALGQQVVLQRGQAGTEEVELLLVHVLAVGHGQQFGLRQVATGLGLPGVDQLGVGLVGRPNRGVHSDRTRLAHRREPIGEPACGRRVRHWHGGRHIARAARRSLGLLGRSRHGGSGGLGGRDSSNGGGRCLGLGGSLGHRCGSGLLRCGLGCGLGSCLGGRFGDRLGSGLRGGPCRRLLGDWLGSAGFDRRLLGGRGLLGGGGLLHRRLLGSRGSRARRLPGRDCALGRGLAHGRLLDAALYPLAPSTRRTKAGI